MRQKDSMEIAGHQQRFWDRHARRDPLWAILSDPTKTGRRWDLQTFLATGRREISLLMYQLRSMNVDVDRRAALDFGCGIGRLSQPLALHFKRVVGVDISPEMIRLAREINDVPERVDYICSARTDLASLRTGEFTFMYSNVVLQHIEPDTALRYLRDLFRVVAPEGVLVFQLPSHPRPDDQQAPVIAPMTERAYRASIHVTGQVPDALAPGEHLVLAVSVRNASDHAWSQREAGAIRLGNHWWDGPGRAMLIQDDGRTLLPANLLAGDTCAVCLPVTVPREPGDYHLECDVVHEGISWFADKGSTTWRRKIRVSGPADAPPSAGGEHQAGDARTLSLPDDDSTEAPGPLPMHGIPREVVEELIRDSGATLVHLEIDERCGTEWVGYRYFVKNGGAPGGVDRAARF